MLNGQFCLWIVVDKSINRIEIRQMDQGWVCTLTSSFSNQPNCKFFHSQLFCFSRLWKIQLQYFTGEDRGAGKALILSIFKDLSIYTIPPRKNRKLICTVNSHSCARVYYNSFILFFLNESILSSTSGFRNNLKFQFCHSQLFCFSRLWKMQLRYFTGEDRAACKALRFLSSIF